jgi:hypothetical protein
MMRGKMKDMLSSARFWFIAIVIAISLIAISDHLASPASKAVASQSGGGACAPCGAPCTLTEK